KTWEGFAGGWLMTMVFGFFAASFLARYPYMHCPVKDLSTNAFSGTHCDLNPVFVPETYEFPGWLAAFFQRVLRLPIHAMAIAPFQWHVLVLACFASLIAPFGGFFASGLKRAFKIKDFGQSIPGHGGITDRMDCQFMMGVFSYIYCKSFINISHPDAGALFQAAVTSLSADEQLQLYRDLGQYLTMQSILPVPTLLSP
ncbi:phosphatidate cytidylyltransferase, partial [Dimargaris xerosporica]